ncbi:hypothetical protein PG991_009011 [Apiospora marii]|uniref:Major facilitator superfamily (MFS) profile domain-containing protein n=1 Tax=Apiospora marii TaxID=335849 RepID=A0ABR1RJY2_9PEZI
MSIVCFSSPSRRQLEWLLHPQRRFMPMASSCALIQHIAPKGEKGAFAGSLAISTAIANVCGVVILGPLQHTIRFNPKLGLSIWLVSRASSIGVLAVAVTYRSILLAFVGRIFEGFATDNLLHFNLGAIFVSVSDHRKISRLMGTSLGLYMLGMSLSSTIAGLLPNFFSSFIMALAIFAASLLYLGLFVPVVAATTPEHHPSQQDRRDPPSGERSMAARYTYFVFRPLLNMYSEPSTILPGLALLLCNTAQAYIFPAIMVYTSVKFNFTGRENGYVISVAAAVSALYLAIVSYVVPKIRAWHQKNAPSTQSPTHDTSIFGSQDARKTRAHDLSWALVCMVIQLLAVPCLMLTVQGWQIFPCVVVIALGLAAPSFIKSLGISLAKDRTAAVASLSLMESMGGLLSPVVLGSVQSWWGEEMVFVAASCSLGIATLTLLGSFFSKVSKFRDM